MLAAGIDTVVLGCTHYPFVIPLIEQIAGPGVRVIDPAPAVARQARRRLYGEEPPVTPGEGEDSGRTRFFTTGDANRLARVLQRLLKIEAEVERLQWIYGALYANELAGHG
jgi:glutamate racemase